MAAAGATASIVNVTQMTDSTTSLSENFFSSMQKPSYREGLASTEPTRGPSTNPAMRIAG